MLQLPTTRVLPASTVNTSAAESSSSRVVLRLPTLLMVLLYVDELALSLLGGVAVAISSELL